MQPTWPLSFFVMGFSLLSMAEFFADPKNEDMLNNKPPAMRVEASSYTKKSPFQIIIEVFESLLQ